MSMSIHLAFKCAYNDGGQGRIAGYQGLCSEDAITFNIRKRKTPWCKNESDCCDYYSNNFSGSLREIPCMESVLFKKWIYGTGKCLKNPNGYIGKLAIFTTRFPDQDHESKRKIIGLFLISKISDDKEYNCPQDVVYSHKTLRIALPLNIAKSINFWNYYSNKSGQPKWGHGLYRYMKNDKANKLLNDIKSKLTDMPSKHIIKEMLKNVHS